MVEEQYTTNHIPSRLDIDATFSQNLMPINSRRKIEERSVIQINPYEVRTNASRVKFTWEKEG
jgi:hypothetical protein